MTMTSMQTQVTKKMFKVLCPIERKGSNTTYWMRVGVAFPNRDQSLNLYLDVLPSNGRLQVREYDEDDLRERDAARERKRSTPQLAAPSGASDSEIPF